MFTEQPGLFGDAAAPAQGKPPELQRAAPPALAFLPGVKPSEAFPDISDYTILQKEALVCMRCRLRTSCQQVVFGDGPPDARLMLIGEGPGKDEDAAGIPFVGRAGQLLDKILQAAEIKRKEVYIGNVVKCRPPGNRLPNPDEVKECQNYLEAQIRIIKPQMIVCLGALASQVVIDPKARIGQVRGRWFARNGIKIMATYHPAALLRNESYKRPVWEDFKQIRDTLKALD
jgi:uracil-DNA glycosylase family 4